MEEKNIAVVAGELGIPARQVINTLKLLDEGATVPFIARYRKELTGNLDEVVIAAIRDRTGQLRELDKRRDAVIKSISEQGKLTEELEQKIHQASSMAVLEDIYLPFRPKRKTRASIAREKGLEPLAELLFAQGKTDVQAEAGAYTDAAKDLPTTKEVLAGARDIIAEWMNEDAGVRASMRNLYAREALISSQVIIGKEQEGIKYKDYYDWSEPLAKIPAHRLLAMLRGENEIVLLLNIAPPEEKALALLSRQLIKGNNEASAQVELALKDAYKRLLGPSMQTEVRTEAKKKASDEAIRIFAENVRQLLMSAPLGQKNVMAIDPGFRTGCKVVCLNRQGDLLHNETIYPHHGRREAAEAAAKLQNKVDAYKIEAIAIGNGTASRETEAFVKDIRFSGTKPLVVMVNESGASIYSASDVAREEFPEYDITVRGAVSIGRRLMDPMAELVKIDAKSIGVGQYQHDVDQNDLQDSLHDVVMSCVNAVGVEVNTASKQLLTYVSGLGPQLAQNIVEYRKANGPFASREQLKKVPRMGDKAFEQAAGFLRIRDSENPLDRSAVHPESYPTVQKMTSRLSCTVEDLMKDANLRKQVNVKEYVTESTGLLTLNDIMSELSRPGRDPREKFEAFSFAEGVNEVKDLKIGMKLPGVVTNITAFGAFVDIGVHQDGLVHISQMADRFVRDPNEVVKLQQKVDVTVLDVDIPRKRIQLSMKQQAGA
jgi:protein Tex